MNGTAGIIEVSLASPSPIQPDVQQAITFFAALYPTGRGESIHFRGVPEPRDGRPPRNLHYALNEDFHDTLRGFLDWCAVDARAAFFLPGVVRGQGTHKEDVLSLPAILCDFDKGNPDENLKAAEKQIGPATIVVESGGKTEAGPKLHAYWRLDNRGQPADIDSVCKVREVLANNFGGDAAFKQAAQVIRVPGSIHLKGEPKLVKLRTVRPEAVYDLDELAQKIGPSARNNADVVNIFDFNNVGPFNHDAEAALTQVTHEGAVDDMTRFEAAGKALGYFIRMVRDGKYTPEQAWVAAQGWSQANLSPPWSEERLRNDFERLIRRDLEAHGPIIPIPPALVAASSTAKLTDWYARDRFKGPAPERQWLAEGLIPAAGVFAAVGDAGKSMMSLRLAIMVASYPPSANDALLNFSSPSFFGKPIIGRGTAVVLTGEDDQDEVHRRLAAIDPTGGWGAESSRLIVHPLISDGGARPFIASGKLGPEFTPAWLELRTQLKALPDLALVVLDPLIDWLRKLVLLSCSFIT